MHNQPYFESNHQIGETVENAHTKRGAPVLDHKELVEVTYMSRWSRNTRRRLHTNNLREINIQKGVFNIHLTEWPPSSSNKHNKSVNRCHFGHKSKCLLIVNIILLCESPSNEMSLAPFNKTIRFGLDFIYPFAAYRIYARWHGNKIPSMGALERC